MMTKFALRCFLTCTAAAVAQMVPQMAHAQQQDYAFNIPAQDLDNALRAFARATRQQVVFRRTDVTGKRSSAVIGTFGARDGLTRLLSSSGMVFSVNDQHVFVIGKDNGGNAVASADDEIIVTARKRKEGVIQVPQSISVIGGNSLRDRAVSSYRDYLNAVPGVALADFGDDSSQIIIRGQATAPDGLSATETYVDDIPIGGAEFKPVDLERVEVLRGPQGTVFGAGSIGGVIRLIPREPVLGEYSGYVDASAFARKGGDNVGTDISGVLNAPFGDTAAMRLALYRDDTPDFIRNQRSGQDIGGSRKTGGRVSLLWQPDPAAKFLLSYMREEGKRNGDYGSFLNSHDLVTDAGPESRLWRSGVLTGKASYDFGGVVLSSVTGYVHTRRHILQDVTRFVFLPFLGEEPEYNVGRTQNTYTKTFTQEVRLSSDTDGALSWVVGGFYSDRRTGVRYRQFNADTGEDIPLADPSHYNIKQFAGFGEATFRFADVFELAAGLRYSEYRTLSYSLVDDNRVDTQRSNDHAISPRASLSYKPNRNATLYVQAARGFRPGGSNGNAPSDCAGENSPTQYGPDNAWNYEVGGKFRSANGAFSMSGAAYVVEWKGMPVFVNAQTCAYSYLANAGSARTKGVEAEASFRFAEGFTLRASGSYNSPRLTSDTGGFASGQRLPGSPDFTGTMAVDYDAPISSTLRGFGTIEGQYLGSIKSYLNEDYAGIASLFNLPADTPLYGGKYAVFSLRAGVRSDRWRVSIFANNLFDRRGTNTINLVNAAAVPQRAVAVPRTIGLALGYDF